MKSEKAKEYITHATCTAQEYAERFGGRELVVSRWDVSTAIELAEQDAEERMWKKAVRAYCQDCCCTVVGECRYGIGSEKCDALRDFIQKLNENEKDKTSR